MDGLRGNWDEGTSSVVGSRSSALELIPAEPQADPEVEVLPVVLLQGVEIMSIPSEIAQQKYISLTTFRKTGVPVRTPLWFAEADGRLYFMTRSDFGKYKRIRNNPKVLVAPCTMRGKVTGPDFPATARILPPDRWAAARRLIRQKYWLANLPFWSSKNEYLEIEFTS